MIIWDMIDRFSLFFVQYPAMFIICILIITTGLVWPYIDIFSNILDIVLSVDVMLLLLIRNTRQFNDDLNKFSFKELSSTNSSCVNYELEFSALSYILIPFFYAPLLITLAAAFVWVAHRLRFKSIHKRSGNANGLGLCIIVMMSSALECGQNLMLNHGIMVDSILLQSNQ